MRACRLSAIFFKIIHFMDKILSYITDSIIKFIAQTFMLRVIALSRFVERLLHGFTQMSYFIDGERENLFVCTHLRYIVTLKSVKRISTFRQKCRSVQELLWTCSNSVTT